MKTGYFITIILSLSILSCEKEPESQPKCLDMFGEFEPVNKPGEGDVEFIFFDRSDLDIIEYEDGISVEKIVGNRLVFKYEYQSEDDPNIADDEYSEVIWFALNPKNDSFEINPTEFKKSAASFGRMCYCKDRGYHRIADGCIYGKKLGEGKWEISLVIKIVTDNDTYIRMIKGDYLASL